MDVSEELLIAYADGELSGEELRYVEDTLKTRPELRGFVERQRALRGKVENAFRPLLSEDVPQAITDAVFAKPVSAQWRWGRAIDRLASQSLSRRILVWSGIPAAAALTCGVLLGIALAPQGAIQFDNAGSMTAQGALNAALETQLASTQDPSRSIRIGISFAAKDGRFCRSFENDGTSGVACRTGRGWSIVALASAPKDGSEYRMAAGMPDSLRAAVSGLIEGQPLDATAERAARDRGWAPRKK